jgi:hypothetical protein
MFNPRGRDHPRSNKVLTATLDAVSSNDGEWAVVAWPNGDRKLEAVLKELKAVATRDACVQLLCVLLRHLFTASTVAGVAATTAMAETEETPTLELETDADTNADNDDSEEENDDSEEENDTAEATNESESDDEGMLSVITDLLASAGDDPHPKRRR